MKVADGIQEMAAMQVVKVKNVDLFEFKANTTKFVFFIDIHERNFIFKFIYLK